MFVSRGQGPPAGWPFVVRVMDDRIWCTTYRTSVKLRRIVDADQAACLLFVDETSVYPYAVVEGTIEVVEPTEDLVRRWLGDSPEGGPRSQKVVDRLLSGKRVFICLSPGRPPATFGFPP
jgi:hypothetical protein